MVAFPEDYKLLVPGLLIETMNSISASFVTRIDTFTSEATAASRALIGGISLVNGLNGGGFSSETYHFILKLTLWMQLVLSNLFYSGRVIFWGFILLPSINMFNLEGGSSLAFVFQFSVTIFILVFTKFLVLLD